tara:strand:+ start:379 stop:585 length:207 start_codon:yes stop_codon:yes gene_type:complete
MNILDRPFKDFTKQQLETLLSILNGPFINRKCPDVTEVAQEELNLKLQRQRDEKEMYDIEDIAQEELN